MLASGSVTDENCWADTSTPRSCNFGQKQLHQGITVNTGFDVHDAVQARHLAKQTVEVKVQAIALQRVEAGRSLSHATVSG